MNQFFAAYFIPVLTTWALLGLIGAWLYWEVLRRVRLERLERWERKEYEKLILFSPGLLLVVALAIVGIIFGAVAFLFDLWVFIRLYRGGNLRGFGDDGMDAWK